jgi:hypothetical protein
MFAALKARVSLNGSRERGLPQVDGNQGSWSVFGSDHNGGLARASTLTSIVAQN